MIPKFDRDVESKRQRGQAFIWVHLDAVENGNIVGTSGSANVYRIINDGVEQNIAIGIGSNGFIVRANPVSSWKVLP